MASGAEIPAGVLAAGSPAEVKRPIEGTAGRVLGADEPAAYAELARRHAAGVELIEPLNGPRQPP